MNKVSLINQGVALIKALQETKRLYHVKSDDYTILEWEINSIVAKVTDLERGCDVEPALRDSTLLSNWGKSLAQEIQPLSDDIAAFHRVYEQYK